MSDRNIKDEVNKKKKKAQSSSYDFAFDALGVGLAFVNFPMALGVFTLGIIATAMETNSNMNEIAMSDAWMKRVSESKGVSPEGLAFLSKRLSKNGYISVADASKWLRMEEEIAEKEAKKKEKASLIEDLSVNAGASALLNRAKEECGSFLSLDTITDGFEKIKSATPSKIVDDGLALVGGFFSKDKDSDSDKKEEK